VPLPLKVFLVALAIVDDIGAVAVIAIFYTGGLSEVGLAVAGALLLIAAALNWAGARNPVPYFFLGIGIWLSLFRSGVHPAIAGMLLAMMIPLPSGCGRICDRRKHRAGLL